MRKLLIGQKSLERGTPIGFAIRNYDAVWVLHQSEKVGIEAM